MTYDLGNGVKVTHILSTYHAVHAKSTSLSVFTDKKFSGPIENASNLHVKVLGLLKFERNDQYVQKTFRTDCIHIGLGRIWVSGCANSHFHIKVGVQNAAFPIYSIINWLKSGCVFEKLGVQKHTCTPGWLIHCLPIKMSFDQ